MADPMADPMDGTNHRYADFLGRVTLQRSETISGLIRSIYGDYNSRYFKSLILANPHIEDPDRVAIGQTVILPAIPADVKPLDAPVWWVQLARTDSLEEAYRTLRTVPKGSPSLRLLPYWLPDQGMQFALVLDHYYRNKSAATERLRQLPRAIAGSGEVLSIWSKEAVFFADPFFGHRTKHREG